MKGHVMADEKTQSDTGDRKENYHNEGQRGFLIRPDNLDAENLAYDAELTGRPNRVKIQRARVG